LFSLFLKIKLHFGYR